MRSVPLTVLKGGINRSRTKGGARSDQLYDLINGHLTDAGTVRSRPGSLRAYEIDAENVKGLMSFDGQLCVFSHTTVGVPEDIRLFVLLHPDPEVENPQLERIHFAAPYLGAPYVVAEFTNGDIFHYWLRPAETWQADTVYRSGTVVQPEDETGLTYLVGRLGAAYPSWTPDTPRAVSDIVEPTVYNDFFYTVVSVVGANPRSGAVEPIWPEADGEQVIEDVDGSTATAATPTAAPDVNLPPPDVIERYGL